MGINSDIYARQEAILRDEVAALNAVLGLDEDARHRVTYGYIGNCDNRRDDRRWYVFLPHPGRVGNANDRLGGHDTGSVDGIVSTRAALRAFARGAEFAKAI